MNPTISLIPRATATDTSDIQFRSALEKIRSGQWSTEVERVRQAYSQGGKKAADAPKKDLPGLLFSGTFKRRATSELIAHSGLICADLDELHERTGQIKELIAQDPHVLAAFVSPSGAGLKVVFACNPRDDHKDIFLSLEHHVLAQFGLQIDPACKDVSRICFVSHDPELFEADTAEPLPPYIKPEAFKPANLPIQRTGLTPGDDYDARGDFKSLLRKHGWTEVYEKHWRRPDKDTGISATLGVVSGQSNGFYVFTSSTQFQERKTYRPWHAYAILEHGGDFHAAVRELGKQGFGEQQIKKDTKTRQESNLERIAGSASEPVTLDALEQKRITLASNPQEPTTRLFLAGKPVATPGNLVTLISKAKTGKTATIGGVVAAIIGAHFDRPNLDTFKFTAPHTKEAVILIDTEQSPFDAYTCHKRAFARAAQESDIDWLMHYALVGMSADQLKGCLPQIMERAKAKHKEVFTLILDGVADFVNSVNDEAECNGFITWLRALAVQYNCPIICVIHSNEAQKSGDDGRGHLGKQLTRKAESNLLLKKVGEVTTITSEKQRKAPITENDGVSFQWSDEHGRHVSCQNAIQLESKAGRKAKYDAQGMLACVPGPTENPMMAQSIHRIVGELPCSIDIRTFKDYLAKWVETGEVERLGDAKKGFNFRRKY